MKRISIKRGFTEIGPLFDLITPYGAYICGGYARYCASPNIDTPPAGDCDVYFRDEASFDLLRAEVSKHLEVKHENDNSVTYKRSGEGLLAFVPTVQLIKPHNRGAMVLVGQPEEVINNFDFPVTRAVILSPLEALVDDEFEEDEMKKLLHLRNIHCPVSSLYRCIKYIKKGYWIKPRDVLSLFLDWEQRTDEYRGNLVEALHKDGDLSQEEIDELEKLLWID